MRQSRYVWLIGLSLFCMMTLIVLKTPQKVISTLAQPEYGSSAKTTIQQFWKFMDLRQTNLARDLLILPKGSGDESEFKLWESQMNNDPLLSLQKVEFLNSDMGSSDTIIVRVSWKSTVQEIQLVLFSMNLIQTEKGWKIQGLKRINSLSYIGRDRHGSSFQT
ncbi:hypothetical protein Desor_3382 [Desulfosporosinus orientis DSM 765]|uniref:DUF3828 domain-containing protein n=1 Tax=Desulfosporosinus orientis (strain ATCC 19365 / DSM 765 / NCIMB 8382 / VKM B-1628 / Singapore I) TaxID=768706 RepID=G7WDX2_DESOD|nr:hypothetical protein [Desulfosporosinus orientis]AET68879.1 hypothetical protein Desor_3382 [Desulfosporosinus orientis DSM 765]